MTLIVALGNTDQVIQISDRRLTSNGKLIDDELNKCGVLFCNNARMAFGFTGLARWKNFETTKWLLEALHNSAPPDYTIGETLERLKLNASETFKSNSELKDVDKRFKKLAIMFSGYINLSGVYKQGCAILSNYHNFEKNTSFSYAQDDFKINYSSAREGVGTPTLVQRVGNWSEMSSDDIDEIRGFLLAKKPSSAIIGKSIELIRNIADKPRSGGTIGKQLTSICIPSDLKKNVSSNYYSIVTKPETYMPALVYLLPGQHMTVDNISIKPVKKNTKPLSVPKVGRNTPCPCGSGLKYKQCHGKH